MGDVSNLAYPGKSHRKTVVLPPYSTALAEFFGIMMGDGGIGNPWQATITLNSIADAKYAKYVSSLCLDLFGIVPAIRKRKGRNALVLCLSSITLVDFLVRHGLCRGDKLKQGLRIPEWILHNRDYKMACIRGLVDTDGGLYIHKHTILKKKYENIGFCFTSHSRSLILQAASIFEEFEIMPHISKRGTDIYLYKAEAVAKYLGMFGTSNPRISSVYTNWKRGRVVEGARLESV